MIRLARVLGTLIKDIVLVPVLILLGVTVMVLILASFPWAMSSMGAVKSPLDGAIGAVVRLSERLSIKADE